MMLEGELKLKLFTQVDNTSPDLILSNKLSKG